MHFIDKISSFKINGMSAHACSDSTALELSLTVEGLVKNMSFCLLQNGKTLWQSDSLPFSPHSTLEFPLLPKQHYTVRAAVEGNSTDEVSLELDTGFMGEAWQAAWIEPEQENGIPERKIKFFEQFVPMPDHFGGHNRLRPVQELRRTFFVNECPDRAVMYASAHGVYTLYLNGRRVDARRLAPETTPYEQMLYYQIYDLTNYIIPGENTLSVLLGDGWWIGRIGLTGDSCQYGNRLAFLGQLEIGTPNGKEFILTDSAYDSRPSHITYSDLMMGEKWDLTFKANEWTPCKTVGAAGSTLRLQTVEPIAERFSLEPISLFHTPNGELVADFGKCIAGVAEIVLDCTEGRVVTLDHSETIDTDGNFFRNILGRNKDQQDVVVCGNGGTRFCPEFTYHGFRYVRITGASLEEIKSIRAVVIGTPIDSIGSFSCSHKGLATLQDNICRSTRSNMVSVPTDCPQREKMGWTGDIQVFIPTGCFNYDLLGFMSAWLGQMRVSQAHDGGIPIIIPSYPKQTDMQLETNGGNTSSAWSDACVLVPLELYKAFGDTSVLRDNLAMMEKWMKYIESASHDYLWTDGYHFGDWLIPSYQNDIEGGTAVTAPVIAACQYALTTAALIEVLEALNEPCNKIEYYRTLLSNIRNAVRNKFVHDDGTVEGGLQGLYVMVLYSGCAQGDLAKKVAAQLVRIIEENGGGLDTGFVSTPHLLDVLCQYGYHELAMKLLMRTESPSWLYQVEHGATSIWENWNAIRPDGTVTTSSFNHYSLGSVGDWIYRNIGGLKCKGAGWSEVLFEPDISCGLEWAKCSHRSPYGLISCSWKLCGITAEVEVTVPHSVKAEIRIPGTEHALTAGTHTFTCRI